MKRHSIPQEPGFLRHHPLRATSVGDNLSPTHSNRKLRKAKNRTRINTDFQDLKIKKNERSVCIRVNPCPVILNDVSYESKKEYSAKVKAERKEKQHSA